MGKFRIWITRARERFRRLTGVTRFEEYLRNFRVPHGNFPRNIPKFVKGTSGTRVQGRSAGS